MQQRQTNSTLDPLGTACSVVFIPAFCCNILENPHFGNMLSVLSLIRIVDVVFYVTSLDLISPQLTKLKK